MTEMGTTPNDSLDIVDAMLALSAVLEHIEADRIEATAFERMALDSAHDILRNLPFHGETRETAE